MRIIVAIIATFLPLMLSAQPQFSACRKLLELEDTVGLVNQASQALKLKNIPQTKMQQACTLC